MLLPLFARKGIPSSDRVSASAEPPRHATRRHEETPCCRMVHEVVTTLLLNFIVLLFVFLLTGITLLHGGINLRWFEERPRSQLTIAHLPVT